MINNLLYIFQTNFFYLIFWFIIAILTTPTSVIFHELGHILYAKYIIPKTSKEKFEIKGYLNITPHFLTGGSKFFYTTEKSIINLSDILEKNKEYKKLIHLYSIGIKLQSAYILLTSCIITLLSYFFISREIIVLIFCFLSYSIPQIIFTITNTFGKNEEGTNDRTEIKKYKQIIKAEKENNKRKVKP